ncbi:MAG: glycosyltransferase family 4 protein [Burkholderiales bacterium]
MAVLARALVDREHVVAAITTDYSTPIESLEPFRTFHAPGLTAYFCPQRTHSFRNSEGMRGRALDFFRYERDCLKSAIEDFSPEVIHAHWTYEFVWAGLDSTRPIVATAHDSPAQVVRYTPNLYRAARYLMARRVIPRCRHLTAVSPDLAADIQHFAKAPITVVPNPISKSVMAAEGCAAEAFENKSLMMVLNGWDGLKNGARALRAFALARRTAPALRLDCFGAGFEVDGPAQQWARKSGLDGNISFLGPVPHHQIIEHMRSSTALLHPSRWESCCMAIAESMSVGLPVVAGRRSGGVAWQLDNGQAGILADVTDVDDLARCIIAMTGDRGRWHAMSTAARSRARQLFSVENVADQYVQLYAKAIKGERSAAA